MRRANTQAPSRRKREVEPASLRAAVDGRESGPPLETYRREGAAKHESGNVAIDEGYFVGTNTGDLHAPNGDSIPATGKQVRVRDCDVVVAEYGLIREHHFYWDLMEFLGQLGLLPEGASG
jgi:hypothetical protein